MSIHALPDEIAKLLDAAADRYGVPRPLARAVAWVESRGKALAVNRTSGALGVMQLMPATAKDLGVVDPLEPRQNIDAGVRYLAQQIAKYGERAGLAAYNWGPGNVAKHGGAQASEFHWPTETKTYVTNALQRAEYELATMGAGIAARPLAPESSSPASQPSSGSHSSQRKDRDDP